MIRLRLVLLLIAWLGAAPVLADPVVVNGSKDGLVGRLTVDGTRATLDYHFERPLPERLSTIVPSYNGRIIPVGQTQGYPLAGDLTAALVIVDVTGGPARAQAIAQLEALGVRIFDSPAPHRRVGLARADGGLSAIRPEPGQTDWIDMMLALGTSSEPADLSASLTVAIAQLEHFTAARRTIFLFTDGHSDKPIDFEALAAAARKAGVSVNIVAKPDRPADLPQLAAFARATGGTFVSSDADIQNFLGNPFRFVDSGASVGIDLTGLRHYWWDASDRLRVSLAYGGQVLVFQAPVGQVRDATFGETVATLWETQGRTIAVMVAVAGWVALLIFMPFARLGRRKRPKVASPRTSSPAAPPALAAAPAAQPAIASTEPPAAMPSVLAAAALPPPPAPVMSYRLSLADPAVGYAVSIDLRDPKVTIGRARDNTVVVPRDTVSSYQAVLIRNDDGSYGLSNLSTTNPTLVNGAEVQFQRLKPGDRLGMGSVEGQFENAGR